MKVLEKKRTNEKGLRKDAALKALFLFFCGVLSALPLIFSQLSLLILLFLSPFFYFLLQGSEGGRTAKQLYLYALCFFQGFYMASFSFFLSMYPLEFAGLSPLPAICVLVAATVLLPLFQAVSMALVAPLTVWLGRHTDKSFPLVLPFALASVYTLLSFLQNFTWMGVPWAPLSIALTAHPILIQGASLFGHHFLIFLIVAVNALLAEAVLWFHRCQDKKALLTLSLATILFFSNLAFGALRLSGGKEGEALKVAVLQGNVSTMESDLYSAEDMLYSFAPLARAAAKADPEIAVMLWAEAVYLDALELSADTQVYLGSIARETGAIQVIGSYSLHEDSDGKEGFYNSLFVFYPDGSMSEEIYDKRRPVPFGEYLPWASFFKALIPPLADINMLSRDIAKGEGASLFSLPFGKAGGLICFDSLYPALARESTQAGASILFLATNDSWFDGSFAKRFHFAHAILRAVECGRSVARAGNTGISGFIDPYGNVQSATLPDVRTYSVQTASLSEDMTLYARIGDAFMLLPLLYTVALPLIYHIKQRRATQERSKL